jgi:hypothetical protein
MIARPRRATAAAAGRAVGSCAAFAIGAMAACWSCSNAYDESAPLPDGAAAAEASADSFAVDAGTDVTTVDAATDTAGGAGRVNLLANGDFELGCAAWTASNGDLTSEPIGRNGKACRVCKTTGANSYELLTVVAHPTSAGQKYVAEAYLRAAPGADASTSTSSRVLVLDSNSTPIQAGQPSSGPVPIDQWQSISALISVTVDGGVRLYFVVNASGGSCFLIDDAVLYRAN